LNGRVMAFESTRCAGYFETELNDDFFGSDAGQEQSSAGAAKTVGE